MVRRVFAYALTSLAIALGLGAIVYFGVVYAVGNATIPARPA